MICKLATTLALLASSALAKIKIYNPESLKAVAANELGYVDAGLANFGHIQYGTTMVSACSNTQESL